MRATPKQASSSVKQLQQLFLQGKETIKTAELNSMGFDTNQSKIQVGNIKAAKDLLFNYYYLSIIDNKKDLDGNDISTNKKLLHKIQTLWEIGEKEIHFKELIELNILPEASEIRIGNILLSNYLRLDKTYSISLRNIEKNIHDKWLDSSVTMDRVIEELRKFKFAKKFHSLAEVALNKVLEDHFKTFFETVKRSATTNHGLLDLTIGSAKNCVAIELKLSKQLKNPKKSQECRGQIEDYSKQFRSNLLLVIAGDKSDMDDKNVAAAFNKAKQIGVKIFPLYWYED